MNQLLMRRSIMGALRREILLLIMIMVVPSNLQLSEAAIQNFSSSPNTGCACAGDTLTYGCTAVGPGSTLWEGSVLVCAGNSIVLRHTQYGGGGTSGSCNGGEVTARSIEVNNNCYISQLSVRVSPSFNNKTIKCTHDSTMGMKTIGSSTLTILEAPYSSPDNIRLTGVKEGLLTFTWDTLGPNCESANYRVISDCGGCPNETNLTEINCTDLQLSTEARECSLRVHVVLCGGVGNLSSPVAVMLKLPDAPSVRFIPHFSGDTGQLTALLAAISQTDTYAIGDGISGTVVAYVMKIMSNSEVLLNSSLAPMMCIDITCEEFVSIPFQCLLLTDISVTLSAANRLGVGPASNPARIDCINNFVEVKYDEPASTITCTFLDQPESAVSVRSCRIQYGNCLSDLAEISHDSTATANEVVLNVPLTESGQKYCYLVTASNGLDTVMVEGRISTAGSLPVVTVTIVTIFIVLFIVVVAIITMVTVVLFSKLHKKSHYHNMEVPEEYLGHVPLNTLDTAAHSEDTKSAKELGIDRRFNLKRINLDDIVFFKLNTTYPIELKTLVERALKPRKFERGCAFYEFLYKEDISDVQEIIFVNEAGEYFYPDINEDKLGNEKIIGEDLLPPQFEGYRVFVQSTGSGRRYIPKDSMVLYKHFVQIQKHPLIHIDVSKFALRRVPNDCTLKEFCGICKPRANINAVYIELDCIEDVDDILDVMLLDKATDIIFTGTSALHMVKEHYSQSKKIDDRHWRMYIFKEFGEMYQMRKDMYILYEIEVEREEWPLPNIKVPLICADATPFTKEKIEKACTLEAFRDKHNLDIDVYNVFVESSRFSESNLESAQIFDVIIEDPTNENTFYTCRAIWSVIKGYIKEEHRWRVYILKEMGPNFMLKVDTRVLYRAKASQFSDASLKPIVSERFRILTPPDNYTLDDFKKAQPRKCNIFLELDYMQKGMKLIDVVLMEKATGKLYSGLHARDIIKKHFSGAQVLCDVKWKVFVLCKFKSSLLLTNATQVLCQDCGPLAQEFRVLKVDEENVRMSEFIKQEVGDYKKGEAFYEFTQEEDLASYREILHVPKDALEHEDENQTIHLLKLKSDTTFFYGISGARGRGIKPPNVPGKRVFIQCTSQGSRCLNEGMVILYKVECGNQGE